MKTGILCAGYVLMPDHLHALLYQPGEDYGASAEHSPPRGMLSAQHSLRMVSPRATPPISEFMRRFKQSTSRFCRPPDYPEGTLWRLRFNDVAVPGTRAVATKLEYLHYNPVKRSLAAKPEDYPWSSARDYMDHGRGIVTVEFAGPEIE